MAAKEKAPPPSLSEVKAALRARYPENEFSLQWEVASSSGSGPRRYADAVAMGLWPSHGCLLTGFEIKVSRADWLRELRDGKKCEEVQRYCHHWYLVAPADVAKEEELPHNWGMLLYTSGGGLRVTKRAPLEAAIPIDATFMASMLRRSQSQESAHALVEATATKLAASRVEDLKSQYERRLQKAINDYNDAATTLRDLQHQVTLLGQQTGIWLHSRRDLADSQVARIRWAMGDSALTLLRDIGRSQDALKAALALLGQAESMVDAALAEQIPASKEGA